MTMEIVNGVLCLNCSDVERAKKAGLGGSASKPDPLHPSAVISNKSDGSGTSPADASAFGPSVIDQSASNQSVSSPSPADSSGGGTSSATPTAAPGFGVNQPLSSGDRGTQLNLLT